MHIQINGRQIDVGDSLRSHVEERLSERVAKYFDRPVNAAVTFSRDGKDFRVDASLHLSSGLTIQAQVRNAEIYAAFDQSAERLEKQLRRYKRRLRDHHTKAKAPFPVQEVQAYVIAPADEAEDEPADLQPVIVAETRTEIKTLTVGEAVMQLDLLDAPMLLFHNSAHSGLNVVYRRSDGNIGWIDPQNTTPPSS
jgi:ribosomal subunit interface protein